MHSYILSTVISTSNWRNVSHIPLRREYINKILRIFERMNPTLFANDIEKIIRISKKVEAVLYYSSSSFEEYNNPIDLERKIANLYHTITRRQNNSFVIVIPTVNQLKHYTKKYDLFNCSPAV
jgi:hypothetical protein